MKTILVVAAHADDEALGCGGTIARHVSEGDSVHLVLMADGVNSRSSVTNMDAEQRRNHALHTAQKILGISSIECFGFPDNKMDSLPLLDIVKPLESVISKIQPSVIYTHHHGDLNVDHQLTHKAVMTACRPIPGSSVKEIYGFEVLSSTEWTTLQKDLFVPNLFIDISVELTTKMNAIDAYDAEMRSLPHSRSTAHVELLAKHRGYCVGVDAAEAFMTYRILKTR